MNADSRSRSRRWLTGSLLVLVLVGCQSVPAPPVVPAEDSTVAPFDQGVVQASNRLWAQYDVAQAQAQAQAQSQGGLMGQLKQLVKAPEKEKEKHNVAVDPMIDARTGEQTALSQDLEARVMRVAKDQRPDMTVYSLAAEHAPESELLLTGTIAADAAAAGAPASQYVLKLALTELKSGKVVAQSSAHVSIASADSTPTAFDRDSPIVLSDKVSDGYIRTTAATPGQQADASWLGAIKSSQAVAQGSSAYNQAQYPEALDHFSEAGRLDPSGEQLRAAAGLYLASVKLNQMDQAEKAFSRVVALGIGNHNLRVKFLFAPGGTNFWTDPKISGMYDIWLRQIALGIDQSKSCVEIIGHSSHTGSAALNDKLSGQRAEHIRQRLVAVSPALQARTTVKGMGFRENIVGTGTDDATDAVDRRVAFQFHDCSAS